MAELPNRHPEVAKEFNNGKFIVHKTRQILSSIPVDQAHVQNNALSKEMEQLQAIQIINLSALQHWMIAGTEVARVVEEFHLCICIHIASYLAICI